MNNDVKDEMQAAFAALLLIISIIAMAIGAIWAAKLVLNF
jgi:hypothetical protein